MDCLICVTALTQTQHEGVTLDTCPHGHGTWLDRGELKLVAEREDADRPESEERTELAGVGTGMAQVAAAMSQEGRRECPKCSHPMDKLDYAFGSGIVIDSCAEHGVWLDSGELERVEAFAEGQRRADGATPPSAEAPPPISMNFISGIALYEQLHAKR